MKMRILLIAEHYIPGIKGGGPIRSIKNLVDNLADECAFYILTADKDLNDQRPYPNTQTDKWIKVDQAQVYYTNIHKLSLSKMRRIISSIDFDVLYLNTFFNFKLSIWPVLLAKFKSINVSHLVLAPRGQFSQGALGFKSGLKHSYISLAKLFGIYDKLTWQASSVVEKKDIEAIFCNEIEVVIANDLTSKYRYLIYDKVIDKLQGELKLVYLSRIHPIKNLLKALEYVSKVQGKIMFSIYGPIEDEYYWKQCQHVIASLPRNIKVEYHGMVEHRLIMDIFKNQHVFILPTLGENFGHVISEALVGGCPVIISDQTPWRDLEKEQVGWDIDLNDEVSFVNAIQYCINLDHDQYTLISKRAFVYGKKATENSADKQNYLNLFKIV